MSIYLKLKAVSPQVEPFTIRSPLRHLLSTQVPVEKIKPSIHTVLVLTWHDGFDPEAPISRFGLWP